jgi:hypothetical protein
MAQRTVYERPDGRWGWRLTGDHESDIIAIDGAQGYDNELDARAMADKVVGGHYRAAVRKRQPRRLAARDVRHTPG